MSTPEVERQPLAATGIILTVAISPSMAAWSMLLAKQALVAEQAVVRTLTLFIGARAATSSSTAVR